VDRFGRGEGKECTVLASRGSLYLQDLNRGGKKNDNRPRGDVGYSKDNLLRENCFVPGFGVP